MSDEDHADDVYSLRDESDTLIGLLALAAARFRADGFVEPVNAIELAYWLEGRRLGVFFVSDPGYHCHGQSPYSGGVRRRDNRASFAAFYTVGSWAFLHRLAVRGVSAEGPLLRVTDHDAVAVPAGSVRAASRAVGRNLLRVATERHESLFAGIQVTDPHWLIAFEDDDSDEWAVARVSRGRAFVYPRADVQLSREWFARQSGAEPGRGGVGPDEGGIAGVGPARP